MLNTLLFATITRINYANAMRLYFEVCSLARPYDDQTQQRIRLEAEAVLALLDQCARGDHEWIGSEVVEEELARDQNSDRRAKVAGQLRFSSGRAIITPEVVARARVLIGFNLGTVDALHLAAAESENCEVVLTTDDRFVLRASRLRPPATVRVVNPLKWFMEYMSQ